MRHETEDVVYSGINEYAANFITYNRDNICYDTSYYVLEQVCMLFLLPLNPSPISHQSPHLFILSITIQRGPP